MSARPIVQRVLLTNDDGIDAPGLAILEAVAAELAHEVWVIAPEHDQSGTSHSISLHSPLRVSRQGERRFGVQGTPGDCVVMAARHLMKDAPPTLVLSGINRGANLGVETMFSGTVGAAMTGLLLGLPSIALSQTFTDRENVRWDTARALAPGVIRQLLEISHDAPTCLNVNFSLLRRVRRRPAHADEARHRTRGRHRRADRDRSAWPAVSLAALPARSARQRAGQRNGGGHVGAGVGDAAALRSHR